MTLSSSVGQAKTAAQFPERRLCSTAHKPSCCALVNAGIDLSRILLVHPRAQQDGLWAVEQSLRSGNCAAVLSWPTLDDKVILRRLQLAAEAGDALGVLFRPRHFVQRPSAAALRIQLAPGIDGGLSVSILKRRGGWAAGPIHLETHGPLALHSRATIATGNFRSQWQ